MATKRDLDRGLLRSPLNWVALLALVGMLAVAAPHIVTRHWPILGVLAICIATPLVWPHYWLTLTPLIVVAFGQTFLPMLASLLILSTAFAGRLGLVSSAAIIFFTAVSLTQLIQTRRSELAKSSHKP